MVRRRLEAFLSDNMEKDFNGRAERSENMEAERWLRQLIQEELEKHEKPTTVNPHEHRRVTLIYEDGQEWTGILYRREKDESCD